MNFPSKPWTDGQTAELITGTTFVYNATKGAWLVQEDASTTELMAAIDSDYALFNGKITTIDGQIAIIESDISDLRADVDSDRGDLIAKVAVVDSKVDSVTAAIEARIDSDYELNNAKHTVIDAAIGANTNAINAVNAKTAADSDRHAALDARVETVEGSVGTLQTQMSAVLSDASDNSAAIANLRLEADSDVALIEANAATAAANNTTITQILADLDSDGVHIQKLRTDLEAEIAATNADVTAITGRLDSDTSKLQSLQTQIDALGSGSLTDLDNRVTTAEGEIDTLQSDLTTAEGDISTLQSDLTTAEGDISTLQSDLTTAEGEIDTLQGEMSTAQTDISDLQTEVDDVRLDGKIWKQGTAPGSPNANDLWFDTSTGILFSYDSGNSVWIQTA